MTGVQTCALPISNLIVHYADVNWSEQHLDHYSLSVCIYDKNFYNYDFIGEGNAVKANIYQGYEQCAFHQLTGWGNFLRINETSPWGNPYCGGGGALKKD